MNLYSRSITASLKKETTSNTPVIPDTFFGLNEQDIAVEYSFTPAMSVAGIRSKNVRPVISPINAPEGTMKMYVDAKEFGNFINGITGGVTSGKILKLSGISGTFAVAETVTGGTSSATGTVLFVGEDYLLLGSVSGTFAAAETVTGGTSSATGTVVIYSATVYGHAANLSADIDTTYTIQFNLDDSAIRYAGVRITSFDSITQEDNIITAGVKVMAQSAFRHAVVTEALTSGSGSKVIKIDQTKGLVASDSIKVWRDGTGFLDFASSGVKTHTISSISADASITVTNLQTALQVGDLILLAPQTSSYSSGGEFPWIGGGTVEMGASIAALAEECMEEFTAVFVNEFEARHCAVGNNIADRFPQHIIQKSLNITGTLKTAYENEQFMKLQRAKTPVAIRIKFLAGEIASTDINYEFRMLFPSAYLNGYQTNFSQDDVVNEEIPFTAFRDETLGIEARFLLVNEVTSY